jgi:uncharacterized phage protein (TIGR02220 family)
MARIRTLKPEILSDERTAALSDTAFRLFTGLIVLADDYGNVRATAPWLVGQIWWAQPKPPRVAAILGELAHVGLVSLYLVRNQLYAHLNGWQKHQRIDNAGKPHVPGPEHADQELTALPAEYLREPLQLAAGSKDPDQDPDQDQEQERRQTKRKKPAEDYTPEELESVRVLLDRLSSWTAIKYEGAALHKRLIVNQLRAGRSLLDLRKVIGYCADPTGMGWAEDEKMQKYLRPETLFGPETIQRYLDAARAWAAKHYPEAA